MLATGMLTFSRLGEGGGGDEKTYLRTIQPLNMPQPPPHLPLLNLRPRQLGLLLPALELQLAAILGPAIDRARARTAHGAATRRAAAGSRILKGAQGDGQMALLRQAAVGNVPLLRAQRADELLVVADHHDAAAVIADGDRQAAEAVAVEVVGRFVEHEQVRVVPHGAREHDFDFLPAGQARDFIVVGDFRVQADVLEVFGDDLGREFAEAEAFARGFVVVEFLDELVEAELQEGFARDLGVVFWEHVYPFTVCETGGSISL